MPMKVWLPLMLIVAGISCLAFFNIADANYFYNVHELPEKGDAVYRHSLKVKKTLEIKQSV